METDQVDEFCVLKEINDLLVSLDDKEAAQRVVRWMWDKYVGPGGPAPQQQAPIARFAGGSSTVRRKGKASKKKESIGLVKDLNLKPADRPSLADFAAEKNPVNMIEKALVCVYYLSQIADVSAVSFDHIYTAFKSLAWRLPKDFRNMVHQAGSRGWLDTKARDDIAVTTMGENFVEHDLPRTVART